MEIVKVVKDNKELDFPRYAKGGDSGMDLRASDVATIPSKGMTVVSTGVRIQLPQEVGGDILIEAQIRPRSGLAAKHGVFCNFGTVDNGYTGELKVIMFNLGDEDFNIAVGDRIAQLVIAKVEKVALMATNALEETERGEDGLGSTGI